MTSTSAEGTSVNRTAAALSRKCESSAPPHTSACRCPAIRTRPFGPRSADRTCTNVPSRRAAQVPAAGGRETAALARVDVAEPGRVGVAPAGETADDGGALVEAVLGGPAESPTGAALPVDAAPAPQPAVTTTSVSPVS